MISDISRLRFICILQQNKKKHTNSESCVFHLRVVSDSNELSEFFLISKKLSEFVSDSTKLSEFVWDLRLPGPI